MFLFLSPPSDNILENSSNTSQDIVIDRTKTLTVQSAQGSPTRAMPIPSPPPFHHHLHSITTLIRDSLVNSHIFSISIIFHFKIVIQMESYSVQIMFFHFIIPWRVIQVVEYINTWFLFIAEQWSMVWMNDSYSRIYPLFFFLLYIVCFLHLHDLHLPLNL